MKKLFKHYYWKKLIEKVSSSSDRIVKQEILSDEKNMVDSCFIDNKLKKVFKDLKVILEIPVLSGLYKIRVPGRIEGFHDKILKVSSEDNKILRKLVIVVFRPTGSDKAFPLRITQSYSPRSYRIYINEKIEAKDTLMISHIYFIYRNRAKLAFQEFKEFMSLTDDPKLPDIDFPIEDDMTYLNPGETKDILRYCSLGCIFSGKSCPGPICSISRLLSSSKTTELRSIEFPEASEGLVLDKPESEPSFLDTVKACIINWIEGNLVQDEEPEVSRVFPEEGSNVKHKKIKFITRFGIRIVLTGNLKMIHYGDTKTKYTLDNGIEIIRRTDREKPKSIAVY